MLYGKVKAILAARGIPASPDPLGPFGPIQLRNDSDGRGDYIHTWDEAAFGPAPTQEELDAITGSQAAAQLPKHVSTRDIMRRLTPAEHRGLRRLIDASDNALKLWNTLLTGATADVNTAEFQAGWMAIKQAGVAMNPPIWPDMATADARALEILA